MCVAGCVESGEDPSVGQTVSILTHTVLSDTTRRKTNFTCFILGGSQDRLLFEMENIKLGEKFRTASVLCTV